MDSPVKNVHFSRDVCSYNHVSAFVQCWFTKFADVGGLLCFQPMSFHRILFFEMITGDYKCTYYAEQNSTFHYSFISIFCLEVLRNQKLLTCFADYFIYIKFENT